jgi:hypothetical protein
MKYKQGWQCTINVTSGRVRVTVVAGQQLQIIAIYSECVPGA